MDNGAGWTVRQEYAEGILDIPFVTFEFDPAKSAANKVKHGIDFVEAQALWSDLDRLELPARTIDEPRFLIVGRIRQSVWTAAVTYRHEETIRIISVRRSRDNERALYFQTSA